MVSAMSGFFRPRRIAPVAVILALSIRVNAQVIPTNEAPPGPRTGMIVGQVVDAGTGAPIGDAIVRMTLRTSVASPSAPRDRVMTDGDGRFFFADLPAGEYYLQATKDGYAAAEYGQRRARSQSQLLSLGEGERLSDVKLRVWKYAVIGGTVVDEAGEPVIGVAVRALMKNVIAGRVQFGNAEVVSELVPSAITDDRGVFRLSQLLPGTYVVGVPSTQTTLPAAALESPNAALLTELFMSGVQEVAPPGQPRTQQIGDSALMTLTSVTIPPPVSPDGPERRRSPGPFWWPARPSSQARATSGRSSRPPRTAARPSKHRFASTRTKRSTGLSPTRTSRPR
jgi:Carboxypeptidase regulatory-like domain